MAKAECVNVVRLVREARELLARQGTDYEKFIARSGAKLRMDAVLAALCGECELCGAPCVQRGDNVCAECAEPIMVVPAEVREAYLRTGDE